MKSENLDVLKSNYEEPHMTEEQIELMKNTIKKAKSENRKAQRNKRVWKYGSMAAAIVAAFLILPNTSVEVAHAMEQIPFIGKLVEAVTLRDYQHVDDRNQADVEIPQIVSGDSTELTKDEMEKLQQSVEEINKEIQSIADGFIKDFENNLNSEEGYQNIGVKSEIVNTTEEYFTLKLICYQVSGSGTQWNYYYTIDLETGERLQLKELFVADADYITLISENIKQQMQDRMSADEKTMFWLENDIEEWNFKQITDETAFYVNEKGNIVISFNEGDVAPMSMGVVTFEIPKEVTAKIRKNIK